MVKTEFINLYEELSELTEASLDFSFDPGDLDQCSVQEAAEYLKKLGFSGDPITEFASLKIDDKLLKIKLGNGSAEKVLFRVNDSAIFSLAQLKTFIKPLGQHMTLIFCKDTLRNFVKSTKFYNPYFSADDITESAAHTFIYLFTVLGRGGEGKESSFNIIFDLPDKRKYGKKVFAAYVTLINNELKKQEKLSDITASYYNVDITAEQNNFPWSLKIKLAITNNKTKKKIIKTLNKSIPNIATLSKILFNTYLDEDDREAVFSNLVNTKSLIADIIKEFGTNEIETTTADSATKNTAGGEATTDNTAEIPSTKTSKSTDDTEDTLATAGNATEPKNAKLNKARQNNKKIIQAFKDIGLSADDLTVVKQDKNGKNYRKASDKLNILRKHIFGEGLDDGCDNILLEYIEF